MTGDQLSQLLTTGASISSMIPGGQLVGAGLGIAAGATKLITELRKSKAQDGVSEMAFTTGIDLTGQFHKGGKVPSIKLEQGKLKPIADGLYKFQGPSHKQGGIPFVTNTGVWAEAEGDEYLDTKKGYIYPKKYTETIDEAVDKNPNNLRTVLSRLAAANEKANKNGGRRQ